MKNRIRLGAHGGILASCLLLACSQVVDLDGLNSTSGDSGPGGQSGSAGQAAAAGSSGAGGQSGSAGQGASGGSAGDCANADLQTSSEHCGSCNTNCGGGACVAGKCQPEVLIDQLERPTGLSPAPDGGWVIGDDAKGRIFRLLPDGALSAVTASDNPGNLFDIAVAGGFIYWTEYTQNQVRRIPLAGGTNEHVLWGAVRCAWLSEAAGELFISDYRLDAPDQGSLTKGKAGDVSGAVVMQSGGVVSGVATSSSGKLYWAERHPGGQTLLQERAVAGGNTSQVLSTSAKVGAIALSSSRVFWIEDGTTIKSSDFGGVSVTTHWQSPQSMCSGTPPEVCDLEISGQDLVWSAPALGKVYRQRAQVTP